jgi:phage terminase small subunit
MSRRTITSGYTGSPRSEVAGSAFDRGPSNPVRIPQGLDAETRKVVKRIVAENPHLDDHSQTDSIIRLASMRRRYAKVEQQLEDAGYVAHDHKRGRDVVHPLLPVLNQMGSSILSLEKSLGISWIARGQVKQVERVSPASSSTAVKAGPTGRVLKLA